MGWRNPITVANTVIVEGPTGSPVGVYVYTPGTTPGLGNPPIEWISPGLLDPFGNVLPAKDIVSLNTATGQYAQLTSGQANYQPGGAAAGSVPGLIAASGAGLLSAASPRETALDQAAGWNLFSAAATPLVSPAAPVFQLALNTVLQLQRAGIGLMNAPNPVVANTAEAWHAMSLVNNWANVAGFATARYRLLATNQVEVIVAINAAAATASTFFTMPAGYVPASQQPVGSAGANASVPAGLSPWCRVDTSGNLTVQNTGAVGAAWQFFCQGSYSLDA